MVNVNFKHLVTIDGEWASFSLSGNTVTEIKTHYSDDGVNVFVFFKSYFRRKKGMSEILVLIIIYHSNL